MKFSERHELMMQAEKYCEDNGMKPTLFNVVSALDILGFLRYEAAQSEPCPVCHGEKGGRDNWGGWHDCPECKGTGVAS